jgi:cell division protein ZapA (FtsZ GTPase activity inhibitor)
MKQKEITIGDKKYPVAFSMKTIELFESMTGKPFLDEMSNNFGLVKNRIFLIMAAILTVDENSKVTESDIRGNDDLNSYKTIMEMYVSVMELVAEFFEIPVGEKAKSQPKGTKPKN